MDQNINNSKVSYLEFFFWKYYFGNTKFLYLSRRSTGYHHIFFFNFRFSSRKSQSQQKLAKKITHFTIQFCSKNLSHFTNLNSLDIENNILSQHSQNLFDFINFQQICFWFLFGVRKNICTAPFLGAKELNSWSTLKANVCIFLYISLRNLLFQRRNKVFSGKGWDGVCVCVCVWRGGRGSGVAK